MTIWFFFLIITRTAVATEIEDCDEYYLTSIETQKLDLAFSCYTKNKQFNRLVLMHLNGEGTKKDPKKAEAVLKEWFVAEPDASNSLEAEVLGKIVSEHLSKSDQQKRVDFCQDVAQTTIDMNYCASIQSELAEKNLSARFEHITASLTPDQKKEANEIYAQYTLVKKADGEFTYFEYIDGSARNMASLSQESLVRENFLKAIEIVIEKKTLKSVSAKELTGLDKKFNATYQKKLKNYALERVEQKENVKEYKNLGKKVQIAWIKYRDQWITLGKKLYGSNDDVGRNIAYFLTEQRLNELNNSPLGGG